MNTSFFRCDENFYLPPHCCFRMVGNGGNGKKVLHFNKKKRREGVMCVLGRPFEGSYGVLLKIFFII